MSADGPRIAILSPVAWRTPPLDYGPWERVASLLTEGLVARKNSGLVKPWCSYAA